ncbi:hypothetical protein FHU30_008957 [Actinomadura rupiterrae]|nr:hypothetical protein [Actinomadura rupiterrae]MCP2343559.1 hypothetical protein [Actinomadura rupiterrae]
MNTAERDQFGDLLVGGLGGVGSDPDRDSDVIDGAADRYQVRVDERLTPGDSDPLHPGFPQARQDDLGESVQRDVHTRPSRGHKAVGAVEIAAFGDLNKRLALAITDRSTEEARTGMRINDQRTSHLGPPACSASAAAASAAIATSRPRARRHGDLLF